MAKKSAKAARGDADGKSVASDEEIMRQRRRMQAVQMGDLVLLAMSWALWILACLWYLAFQDLQVPSKVSRWLPVLSCLEDGVGNFLVCGQFCAMLARSAPQGNWSDWRKPWYLAWVLVFAWLSFLFFQVSALMHAALCGVLAFTLLTTCPAAVTEMRLPPQQADAPLASVVLRLDAVVLLLAAGQEVAGTSWHRSSAALATSMACSPLVMVALGLLGSATEPEILCSLPTVLLQFLSSGVSSVMHDDYRTAALLVLLFLLHAALYLPLPSNDPESNPFYNSFKRSVQHCVKFLSQPVSGFGHENN